MNSDARPRRPHAGSAIAAIALNTFREAIRDRILYLLLAFALILIALSRLLSLLTVGSEDKIIRDVGLSSISVFGVLTAVFVGVSLVFKEIEKRTILTLLANPVRRWHFLAGKYAGLLSVLAMNVVLMSATLFLLLWIRGEPALLLAPAIALIYLELALVTAFALLFSSFTNPILAAVGTFAIYVVGHLAWSFRLLRERMPEGPGKALCDVLYWALPNLDQLNVRSEVVHGLALDPMRLVWAAAYAIAYASMVVGLACLVFERRDFT